MHRKVHRQTLAEAFPPPTSFSMCCSHPMGNSLIFVSVVVGITAVGCTNSGNEPNLGWAMCQKAHHLALTEALLPFAPFFCVLLSFCGKFIDTYVSCGEYYGC